MSRHLLYAELGISLLPFFFFEGVWDTFFHSLVILPSPASLSLSLPLATIGSTSKRRRMNGRRRRRRRGENENFSLAPSFKRVRDSTIQKNAEQVGQNESKKMALRLKKTCFFELKYCIKIGLACILLSLRSKPGRRRWSLRRRTKEFSWLAHF